MWVCSYLYIGHKFPTEKLGECKTIRDGEKYKTNLTKHNRIVDYADCEGEKSCDQLCGNCHYIQKFTFLKTKRQTFKLQAVNKLNTKRGQPWHLRPLRQCNHHLYPWSHSPRIWSTWLCFQEWWAKVFSCLPHQEALVQQLPPIKYWKRNF